MSLKSAPRIGMSMPRIWRTAAVVSLAIALAIVAIPFEVDAHAALARSNPAAGATLAEPPADIRLGFTEPLEATYTGADLLDASGTAVAGVSVAIAAENQRELVIVPPPNLAEGGYTVAWRTLSAADGHTIQGYFGFRIGDGAAAAAGFAVPVTSGNEPARAATRGLALLGLAALLAIAPVTLIVLDPARRSVPALNRTIPIYFRRYIVFAAAMALLGSLLALAAQAAAIGPEMALPAALAQTLTETRYGQLWALRVVLFVLGTAAVASAFWGREQWRRPALIAGTALAVAMPVPFSLLSHASAQQEGRAAAVAADVLHLLGASIWVGGLFLLVLVFVPTLRARTQNERMAALRTAIPRFSAIGLAAWSVLALTGVYAAWLQAGTVEALRDTPYGQSLLLKLALLVPILALAAFHLALGMGGLERGRAGRFAMTVGIEALLVVAVVLVVGRLIGLEPAREVLAARTPSQREVPLAFSTDDGTRVGSLVISPGAAGSNIFTLTVEGSPLPTGSEAVLRFDLPDQGIGRQELRLPAISATGFQGQGSELALPGDWRIEAIVRAIGAFSWMEAIEIGVAQTPPPAPEANPAPRFAPPAIAGLVAVAVGAAGLAVAATGSGALHGRRIGVGAAGTITLVAGAAIIASARIPLPEAVSEPVIAQAAPMTVPSPDREDGHAVMADNHSTPIAGSATPEGLPGPATIVRGDGLTVAIAARPETAGPVDVIVTLHAEDGVPLTGARVALLSEMPGMGNGRSETTAAESQPGEYVAERVPLSMAGEWRLAVRVSPKGESTQVFSFAIAVP